MGKLEKVLPSSGSVSGGPQSNGHSGGARPDLSRFHGRASSMGLRGDTAIHAPPAYGKTFLAASASAFWLGEERLGEKAIALEDMLWCAVDLGAVDGLLMQRIEVPHYIDVRDLCEEFGVDKGVQYANELVAEKVRASPEIRLVVWDTVSELDKLWQVALERVYGDEDGQWVFRKLLAKHRDKHGTDHKSAASARLVYLAHSAAVREPRKDAPKSVEAQARATRLPGGAEIKLAATGQGRDIYINNSSLVLTIKIEELKGRPTKRIVCAGDTNFEVKNRLQGIVGDREPFDLRALIQRADTRFAEIRTELTKEGKS